MSLSEVQKTALQNDALRSFTRWSLRSLAALSSGEHDSRSLLRDVSLRLARQHRAVSSLLENVRGLRRETDEINGISSSSSSSTGRDVFKRLEALRYVHADTYRLAASVTENPHIWERFDEARRHVVRATAEEVRSRHANTLGAMVDTAEWIRSVASDGAPSSLGGYHLQIDAFLQGRLGVQLLCDHLVGLHDGKPHGGVSVNCSVADVLSEAVAEASYACDAHLQTGAECLVVGADGIRCTLVRPWVHHALTEVLKNAMASSVRKARRDGGTSAERVPPIHVAVDSSSRPKAITIDVLTEDSGSREVMPASGKPSCSVIHRLVKSGIDCKSSNPTPPSDRP